MPSKGRKAASRQAQLNRKKRRGKSPRQPEFEPAPLVSRTAVETAIAEPEIDEPESVEGSTPELQTEATTPAPRVRSARRRAGQRGAAADSTPLVYQYLGKEMRQIGIIASLIVAILVGLTFVLR